MEGETRKNTVAAPPTEQDKKKVREAILRLKSEINPGVWETWMRKAKAAGRNGRLLLDVGNDIAKRWLETEGVEFVGRLEAELGEPVGLIVGGVS